MKINELLKTQSDIDEGIGSFLGKAAGNVVGGLGAAWKDAKQGYQDAKSQWDPEGGGNTAAPAPAPATTGGNTAAPAPAPAPAPATTGGNTAAPAPAPATTGDNTAAPATTGDNTAAPAPAPATTGGNTAAPATTGDNTAAPAPAPATTGDIGGIMQAIDKLDPASKKQLAGELEKNINKPATPAPGVTPPADATATPVPGVTPPADATATPVPGVTPPAGSAKLTPQQIAAKKAELQGKRAAGKTTASQTGSGFKDYVGGSQEKMAGVDASGAPVFKKLQRESVGFSNFLGLHI